MSLHDWFNFAVKDLFKIVSLKLIHVANNSKFYDRLVDTGPRVVIKISSKHAITQYVYGKYNLITCD